jgi:3-methyladenine DNA glycosylase AlkD
VLNKVASIGGGPSRLPHRSAPSFGHMTLKEVKKQLESLGNEKMPAHNTEYGAGKHQFGVPMGDIRKLAKKIKINHELALELWKTGNVDAQFLATRTLHLSCRQPSG